MSEAFFENGENALENDDWCRFDPLSDFGTLMQSKVVGWDVDFLSGDELFKELVGEVEVERLRVVEVVVACIFVLFMAAGRVLALKRLT